MANEIMITLPEWVPDFLAQYPSHIEETKDRMRFVLELTRKNILSKTGGPFGAAVFESDTGKVVSVGVNRVMPLGISSAHAEVVALSFAQKHTGHFDLGGDQQPEHQLVVNAQMCAMCLGAVCWSGVKSVVYSATGQDVESITGFDEGPVPEDVEATLNARGISLTSRLLREEGLEVLKLYVQEGGFIYNARQGE